jgi:hypothetical protein
MFVVIPHLFFVMVETGWETVIACVGLGGGGGGGGGDHEWSTMYILWPRGCAGLPDLAKLALSLISDRPAGNCLKGTSPGLYILARAPRTV